MVAQLEELYRTRRGDFCRAAAAIAGDRDLGEDAVQDAFAKAVRKRRTFRGKGSLEAWVWRIVLNAARDVRRRRPRAAEPHDGRGATTEGYAMALPLELLSERQREVLFLYYYADLNYETIAAALDISSGTVGATLSAARATLRTALTKEVAS
jgi:RNA polymerase sigma-70 factor, ECF subfamily